MIQNINRASTQLFHYQAITNFYCDELMMMMMMIMMSDMISSIHPSICYVLNCKTNLTIISTSDD
jgi:hypothetical protein